MKIVFGNGSNHDLQTNQKKQVVNQNPTQGKGNSNIRKLWKNWRKVCIFYYIGGLYLYIFL